MYDNLPDSCRVQTSLLSNECNFSNSTTCTTRHDTLIQSVTINSSDLDLFYKDSSVHNPLNVFKANNEPFLQAIQTESRNDLNKSKKRVLNSIDEQVGNLGLNNKISINRYSKNKFIRKSLSFCNSSSSKSSNIGHEPDSNSSQLGSMVKKPPPRPSSLSRFHRSQSLRNSSSSCQRIQSVQQKSDQSGSNCTMTSSKPGLMASSACESTESIKYNMANYGSKDQNYFKSSSITALNNSNEVQFHRRNKCNERTIQRHKSDVGSMYYVTKDGQNDNYTINYGTVNGMKCFKIVEELAETEAQYLQSLIDIHDGYQQRLLQKGAIDDSTCSIIFSNISELSHFHKLFLNSMRNSCHDLCQLSQCFVDNAQFFKVLYTYYCTNYIRAMKELQEVQNKYPTLCSSLGECQTRLGHQLPLSTYLLKPVQRILKYQLLLQELVKVQSVQVNTNTQSDSNGIPSTETTPATSPIPNIPLTQTSSSQNISKTATNSETCSDPMEAVQSALDTMTKVAEQINESKRAHETILRGYGLKIRLLNQNPRSREGYDNSNTSISHSNNDLSDTNGILLNAGNMLLEGELVRLNNSGSKRTSTNGSKRMAFLFERALILTKIGGKSSMVMNSANWGPGNGGGSNLSLIGQPTGGINGSSFQDLDSVDLVMKEIIKCSNLMLVDNLPKDPLAFFLLTIPSSQTDNPDMFSSETLSTKTSITQHHVTLQARSIEVKNVWCRELRRIILRNYSKNIEASRSLASTPLSYTPNSIRCDRKPTQNHFFPTLSLSDIAFNNINSSENVFQDDDEDDLSPSLMNEDETLKRRPNQKSNVTYDDEKKDQVSVLKTLKRRRSTGKIKDNLLAGPFKSIVRCPSDIQLPKTISEDGSNCEQLQSSDNPCTSDETSRENNIFLNTIYTTESYATGDHKDSLHKCSSSAQNLSTTSFLASTKSEQNAVDNCEVSPSSILESQFPVSIKPKNISDSSDEYPNLTTIKVVSPYDRCMELIRTMPLGSISSNDVDDVLTNETLNNMVSKQNTISSIKSMTSSTTRSGGDSLQINDTFSESNYLPNQHSVSSILNRDAYLTQTGKHNGNEMRKCNPEINKEGSNHNHSTSISERSKSPRRWVQQVVAGFSGSQSINNDSSGSHKSRNRYDNSAKPSPTSSREPQDSNTATERKKNNVVSSQTVPVVAHNTTSYVSNGKQQRLFNYESSASPSSIKLSKGYQNERVFVSHSGTLPNQTSRSSTTSITLDPSSIISRTEGISLIVPRAVSSHPNLYHCGVIPRPPGTLSSSDLSHCTNVYATQNSTNASQTRPTARSLTPAWPRLVLKFLRSHSKQNKNCQTPDGIQHNSSRNVPLTKEKNSSKENQYASSNEPSTHEVEPATITTAEITQTKPGGTVQNKAIRFWSRVTKTNNNESYKRTLSAPVGKIKNTRDFTCPKKYDKKTETTCDQVQQSNDIRSSNIESSILCDNDETVQQLPAFIFSGMDNLKFADETASIESHLFISSTPDSPPPQKADDCSSTPRSKGNIRKPSTSMSDSDPQWNNRLVDSWHNDNAFWRKTLLENSLEGNQTCTLPSQAGAARVPISRVSFLKVSDQFSSQLKSTPDAE